MATIRTSNNLDKIKELYKKTDELSKEIKSIANDIKFIEFESYTDYFIIHQFKRGISESGRVNIENLRRKEDSIYYKKIKKSNHQQDENIALPPSRALSEDSSVSVTASYIISSDTPTADENNNTMKVTDRKDNEKINKVSSEISTKSIIDSPDTQDIEPVHVRRSSRLSEKERQEKERREQKRLTGQAEGTKLRIQSRGYDTGQEFGADMSEEDGIHPSDSENQGDVIVIKDLYESLVPKIKDPKRRSDWVLPPRMRFTPEKQLHTRPEFDFIKINELVGTERISAVLSRFEGGVAGVRKKESRT